LTIATKKDNPIVAEKFSFMLGLCDWKISYSFPLVGYQVVPLALDKVLLLDRIIATKNVDKPITGNCCKIEAFKLHFESQPNRTQTFVIEITTARSLLLGLVTTSHQHKHVFFILDNFHLRF